MVVRAMAVAVSQLFVLIPNRVTGQTSIGAPCDTVREGRGRLSLQVAAGPTLIGRGNVLSAPFGYSPASRRCSRSAALGIQLAERCAGPAYIGRLRRRTGGLTRPRGHSVALLNVGTRADRLGREANSFRNELSHAIRFNPPRCQMRTCRRTIEEPTLVVNAITPRHGGGRLVPLFHADTVCDRCDE